MTAEDSELLEHYVRRGAAPWNLSLEAAWLDYELRSFVVSRLPIRRPIAVCNVGIGIGLWDDWLGHIVGASITSVDRDPDVCRVFAHRQRREAHPFPAAVVCGDVRDGVLGRSRFDVITIVVTAGDRGGTKLALADALVPGGLLLSAEVGEGAAADRVRTRGDLWLACSTRTR